MGAPTFSWAVAHLNVNDGTSPEKLDNLTPDGF